MDATAQQINSTRRLFLLPKWVVFVVGVKKNALIGEKKDN